MKRYKFLIFIVLLSFIAPIADTGVHGQEITTDYYISPSGSDSNPCSLSEPCLTVAHTQTVVQTAIAGGLTAPVNIYLRGGTYTQSTGLTFGAADSGTSNNPITWQAYPGEVPVVSGGQAITGWVPDTGSIYKANVGTSWNFRQLYVNGVHAQRARGPSDPAGWTRTETGYTPPDSSMTGWGNSTDVEIVSLGPWSMDRLKVAALYDAGGSTTVHAFPTQVVPGANSPLAYELGMQFTSDVSGQVTGLRFYRNQNIADTGTHAGHLWDAAGNLLATATFAASSATGWQDVTLGSPVSISASTVYTVSYSSTVVTVGPGYWPPAVDNVPLHAPTTNGVYSDTPGAFPNTVSATGNNYWVDVNFSYTSAPSNAITMTTPEWTYQQAVLSGYGVRSTPSWVENAYELMASGYWYLNRTTGYLYYWPPSGSMSGVTVVAPVVDHLLTVDGASNLQFNDLVFAHSNWIGPDSTTGYIGLQSGYTWTITPDFVATHGTLLDAAVTVNASSNVTFAGSQFSHIGSRVLLLTGGNAGVTISNNRFDDNAGGAIQVGDANTCATVQESNVTITGNMIAAGNAFDYLDNGGIFVACGAGIVITNNEVARTPWGPIAVGWGWSTTPYATDISISGNYINGPCIGPQPLSWDCGGLYMMGGHSSTASYATGLQATGNYLKGAAYIGLYLDQGSAWATLTSNITQDSVNYWLQISPVGAAANHIQVLGTYSDSANVLNSGTNVTISGTSTISSGTQPFGTPQQAIICAAGVPGATACTTPKTWPTWQTGVGATWSKPQIGP